MIKEDIQRVLIKHDMWLRGADGGIRANLYGANLYEADLREADLREADLRGADLCGANLRGANLHEANLRGANLHEANLREANLRGANLCGADLHEANLRGANLRGADLRGADLCGANLRGANLHGTQALLQCPEVGSFVAFKKGTDNTIVQLLIPEDALRSSSTTRKCRANKAIVIKITNTDGEELNKTTSTYDNDFIYRKGETVEVLDFCEDRWKECAAGIHFFITKKEAEEY